MIKLLKSNKIVILSLLIICMFLIIKPTTFTNSCLKAVSVWSLKIFPLMFPFFVFTRIILNLTSFKPNFMDKLFGKLYHVPAGSFIVFCLSLLCGYPMGAKLISSMYNNGKITKKTAVKLLSICSVSGPIFMIGTVGFGILGSFKAGVIILVANALACLVNGFIYRGKQCEISVIENKNENANSLSDIVYDSLISILLVGAYIVLSFIIIDIIKELKIFAFIAKFICLVLNCEQYSGVIESFFVGIFEITRGIIELSNTGINLTIKTILSSTIIGFGGISVMLQGNAFIKNINIKNKVIVLQKITQSLICGLLTTLLCLLFM